MKGILLMAMISMYVCGWSQQADVFRVKKHSPDEEKQLKRVYEYNIFKDIDTVQAGSGFMVNLGPVQGLYDSIGLFNMTMDSIGKMNFVKFTRYEGMAKFKLYRKKTDGSYEMFYIHNFTVLRKTKD